MQAVFRLAQEAVGLAQFVSAARWQHLGVLKQAKNPENGTFAQARVTSAADQLEYLGNELDFANAAGTEARMLERT